MGGENVSGEEALRIGLVDHVIPSEDFFNHLDEVAHQYLKACSTGTRMSKLVLNHAFDMDYEEILQYYLELQERTQYSLDGVEGKRAYSEKRDPVWQ